MHRLEPELEAYWLKFVKLDERRRLAERVEHPTQRTLWGGSPGKVNSQHWDLKMNDVVVSIFADAPGDGE